MLHSSLAVSMVLTTILIVSNYGIAAQSAELVFNISSAQVLNGTTLYSCVRLKCDRNCSVLARFTLTNNSTFCVSPEEAVLSESTCLAVVLQPTGVGTTSLSAISLDPNATFIKGPRSFVFVSVIHSNTVSTLVQIVGWIYFVCWSVSFYPQVYLNHVRKSVIGLNFDFLTFNFLGFFCYGVYSAVLYWSPSVKHQYFEKFTEPIPVEISDVVFAVHAWTLTAVTIAQCFFLPRGNQKVSKFCTGYIITAVLYVHILVGFVLTDQITWLTMLSLFSYVKLSITLIKYIPQAILNFRRKSTVGWSILSIILDFSGGSLSLLSMFLQGYNTDSWSLILGNFTKFGLGLISILFDVVFFVQHLIYTRRLSVYDRFDHGQVS